MSYRSRLVLTALISIGFSAGAFAQATRTWVSGVGDDANPCSRTAPCKTFAGAISKTAAGGEISVLDPGGFGAVTITKAITINGEGVEAGILGAGTNGVNVNAGAADRVFLRGLRIQGGGTGLNGIRYLAGGALTVDNCVINAFTGSGIDAEPSTSNARLTVIDCKVVDTAGNGILMKPSGSGSIAGSVVRTQVHGCSGGLRVEGAGFASVLDSAFTRNTANGIACFSGGVISAAHSMSSQNGGGLVANNGVIRITDLVVTDNSTHGLNPQTPNSILSFGDNKIAGNNPDNAPSGVLPMQ